MSKSDIKSSVQNPAELEGQTPRQKIIALRATSRLTDFWRPDLVYMQYAAAADIQFICLSPEDRNDIAINFYNFPFPDFNLKIFIAKDDLIVQYFKYCI